MRSPKGGRVGPDARGCWGCVGLGGVGFAQDGTLNGTLKPSADHAAESREEVSRIVRETSSPSLSWSSAKGLNTCTLLNMCSVILPPSARDAIVESALRLFGEQGVKATSLREIAKAAGVSPALVVHHFGGKQGLVAATDDAALQEFAAAYNAGKPIQGRDLLRQRAKQTADAMRQQPTVCAYLGRAMIEGTAGSARLFRMTIDAGRAEIDGLAEKGALREDADRLWATLQHFFLIWAPLSFRALLQQEALEGSMLDQENLDRWVSANERLLREGLYR